MSNLPKWSDCELAVDEERATALQRFIYEYEPGDSAEREWRERLQASRQEERQAVFKDMLSMLTGLPAQGTKNYRRGYEEGVRDAIRTLEAATTKQPEVKEGDDG